jgi:glyoxylase-like metal-dependent hydrolase (beta-lactamase superfamily II)
MARRPPTVPRIYDEAAKGGRMTFGKSVFLAATLVLAGGPQSVRAQNIDFAALELETVKVNDGLYVLMGGPAQGNIAVSIGSDGIFLVDSMYGQMHGKIVDAIRKLSPAPIRWVVNTHLHGDHTAGNEAMAKLGAVVISHENMRRRMADAPNPAPAGALPALTYTDSLTLRVNGEEIHIYHPAPAHTDGDSIIYFRKANVVHVGDIPSSLRYPNIGVNDGGSVEGMMAAARQLMTIANADTRIIPGHLGPIVGFKEIEQQLVMFAAVRDRVASAIRAGRTLEEVVASKPTADFDQGRLGGAITPDRFVTLVYTDLARTLK